MAAYSSFSECLCISCEDVLFFWFTDCSDYSATFLARQTTDIFAFMHFDDNLKVYLPTLLGGTSMAELARFVRYEETLHAITKSGGLEKSYFVRHIHAVC